MEESRVYVGNIPSSVTITELQDFFSQFGACTVHQKSGANRRALVKFEVKKCMYACLAADEVAIRGSVLTLHQDVGRRVQSPIPHTTPTVTAAATTPIAVAVPQVSSAAVAAASHLKNSPSSPSTRTVTPIPSLEKDEGESDGKVVKIERIPLDVTQDELLEFFRSWGQVSYMEYIPDKTSAWVTFHVQSDAVNCVCKAPLLFRTADLLEASFEKPFIVCPGSPAYEAVAFPVGAETTSVAADDVHAAHAEHANAEHANQSSFEDDIDCDDLSDIDIESVDLSDSSDEGHTEEARERNPTTAAATNQFNDERKRDEDVRRENSDTHAGINIKSRGNNEDDDDDDDDDNRRRRKRDRSEEGERTAERRTERSSRSPKKHDVKSGSIRVKEESKDSTVGVQSTCPKADVQDSSERAWKVESEISLEEMWQGSRSDAGGYQRRSSDSENYVSGKDSKEKRGSGRESGSRDGRSKGDGGSSDGTHNGWQDEVFNSGDRSSSRNAGGCHDEGNRSGSSRNNSIFGCRSADTSSSSSFGGRSVDSGSSNSSNSRSIKSFETRSRMMSVQGDSNRRCSSDRGQIKSESRSGGSSSSSSKSHKTEDDDRQGRNRIRDRERDRDLDGRDRKPGSNVNQSDSEDNGKAFSPKIEKHARREDSASSDDARSRSRSSLRSRSRADAANDPSLTRIWAVGFGPQASQKRIMIHFERYGAITNLFCGKSKGSVFAFITFGTHEAMLRATAQTYQPFEGGKILTVLAADEYNQKQIQHQRNARSAYVGRIPPHVSDEELRKHFTKFVGKCEVFRPTSQIAKIKGGDGSKKFSYVYLRTESCKMVDILLSQSPTLHILGGVQLDVRRDRTHPTRSLARTISQKTKAGMPVWANLNELLPDVRNALSESLAPPKKFKTKRYLSRRTLRLSAASGSSIAVRDDRDAR